ncbi:MFS transporter [Clavibacter californiensis]|uniref:MFS transporter n=1 Tax=Clavibacter californiensis TaxID=1401995 RepID=UPI0011C2264A|nr:MFS transporter [Clavibacter californiensis]UKF79687.1 MFS transporter [Clavibacter californiensis]
MLTNRRTCLYLGGQVVSVFGDTVMFLAAAVWVRQLTGSDAAAAAVFFCVTAPSLLAPAVGLLVDRVRRRTLLVATNVAMAAAVLLLTFVSTAEDVGIVYVVMVLYGLGAVVISSAQTALLPAVVGSELLADANGLLQTVRQGLRLAGPLIGVTLLARFGGGTVAVIDAATFLLGAGSLLIIKVDERVPARHERQRARASDLLGGFAHIRADRPLLAVVVASAAVWLVLGLSESVMFVVVGEGLGLPPEHLAVLVTIQGVGAVVGGLTAPRLLRQLGEARSTASGALAMAVASALWAVPADSAVSVGSALLGLGLPWLIVGATTLVQRRSPDELRGRIASAFDASVTVPQTLAIAAGAVLITVVPYRGLLAVMCVVLLMAATGLLVGGRRPTPLPDSPA